MDRARVLLGTPIFRDLRRGDVEELLPHVRERAFARGESVWLEGAPADALWVVATGQLKSYRVSRDGTEVILKLHSAGDTTGEVGMFHPSGRRQVNVAAMVATTCLTIPREPLFEFLIRYPASMRQLLQLLSTTATTGAYAFSGVAFDDIRTRVAATLLALGSEFGESTTDAGVRIRLRLSQTTLAALVAASRENVNRALSGFMSAGAVSQREGHFHLHDMTALRDAAGSHDL